MAKKAVDQNNRAPSELLGSQLQRWRRIAAELDAAAVAHATLAAAAPEPLLIDPQVWFAQALKDHPRQPHEKKAAYARRLYRLLQAAPVAKQWKFETLLRRLSAT